MGKYLGDVQALFATLRSHFTPGRHLWSPSLNICRRRTKRKHIYVISTLQRPVPLEHYLYTGPVPGVCYVGHEAELSGYK